MGRRKKRRSLAIVVIVFALVFMTGAAFAFTTGQLTIGGTATISPTDEYVVWGDVRRSPNTPGGVTTFGPEIQDARGRTDQHIEWHFTIRYPTRPCPTAFPPFFENFGDYRAWIWNDVEIGFIIADNMSPHYVRLQLSQPLTLVPSTGSTSAADWGLHVDWYSGTHVDDLDGLILGPYSTANWDWTTEEWMGSLAVRVWWDGSIPPGYGLDARPEFYVRYVLDYIIYDGTCNPGDHCFC